jgi:hypothetical protein
METRNILARQGTQSDADSIDQVYDILIALSYSIAWLLRTVLLVEAGFDAATLQEAYRCSSAYNHHITTREICAAAALTLPPGATTRQTPSFKPCWRRDSVGDTNVRGPSTQLGLQRLHQTCPRDRRERT